MNLDTFPLGPFIISVGGIFVLIGFVLSALLLLYTTRRKDLPISFLSDNLLTFLLWPLLFGRFGTFLQLLPSYSARIEDVDFVEKIKLFIVYFFSVWEGGLDPTWIILGFLIVFVFVNLWTENKVLEFAKNRIWILVIIGLFIGRVLSTINILLEQFPHMDIAELSLKFFQYSLMIWTYWDFASIFWIFVGFCIAFVTIGLSKETILTWLDAFVSPGILLVVFIHIGGFFSAWGYGKPVLDANFPFTVSYNLQNVRYSGDLHPVQIYGAIAFLLLFIVGIRLHKYFLINNTKWQDGTFFALMTFFAAIINGFLEFFRGDATTIIADTIRLPQILSFSLAFMMLLFLVLHTHEKKPTVS